MVVSILTRQFGNPEYASPTISPDGKLLAYIRPTDGVLNVHVRTVGKNDDRVVTSDRYRGIRQYFWAEDSTTLLYLQDDGGDENFHLFSIDAQTSGATARDLTPYPGAKAQNVVTNKRFPDTLLVAVNNRDPAKFDMYRCHLPTGELTLDTENPGDVLGWGTEDETFEVREAIAMNPADSSKVVRVRDSATSEWRELITFPYGEDGQVPASAYTYASYICIVHMHPQASDELACSCTPTSAPAPTKAPAPNTAPGPTSAPASTCGRAAEAAGLVASELTPTLTLTLTLVK